MPRLPKLLQFLNFKHETLNRELPNFQCPIPKGKTVKIFFLAEVRLRPTSSPFVASGASTAFDLDWEYPRCGGRFELERRWGCWGVSGLSIGGLRLFSFFKLVFSLGRFVAILSALILFNAGCLGLLNVGASVTTSSFLVPI